MPAQSQAQQRLMAQAYALKKGELSLKDLDPDYRDQIKDLADGMTLKQLKDFAATKHDKLPKKVGENMSHIKPFREYLGESETLCEATVEMDAMDPDNKDFLKFLKKNRVKIIDKVMDGPGGGHPVITMQGKRKDLEKVLADPDLGWADPDLAEYIEESAVTENYEVIYSDGVSAMKKFRSEKQALDFMKKTIASNKKLKNIAVYKPGMYSTTQTELVVKFWGDGSYLDNVSKKDKDLAAKKLEESYESYEELNEEYIELPGLMVPAKKLLEAYSKWYKETSMYWEDYSDDMVEDSADEAAKNAQMEILAYLSNKMNDVIKDRKMKVNMDLR